MIGLVSGVMVPITHFTGDGFWGGLGDFFFRLFRLGLCRKTNVFETMIQAGQVCLDLQNAKWNIRPLTS